MIIICEHCGQYLCPPPCPNFSGYVAGPGSAVGTCEVCGARIYEDEKRYCKDGKIMCAECAEELISPELLEFLGCADIKEFFDMLW